jgi:hypothetical protein
MSLVSTRLALRHRCTIQRDGSAGTPDAWGSPVAPAWAAHVEGQPCRTWVDAGREPIDPDRTVTITDRRMIVPRSTDVTTRDRIIDISERGTVFAAGPWAIEAVLERREHLELVLQEIR